MADALNAGFDIVWAFSDVMSGAMAIPDLIGLLLLSGAVVRESRASSHQPLGTSPGW